MGAEIITPLQVFRFQVEFAQVTLAQGNKKPRVNVCHGAFAECTGLEATMEPKTIKEGGRNYGAAQRAGQTTFSTVVLKRGIGQADLWRIFSKVARGAFAPRLQVTITVFKQNGEAALAWKLDHAMPVKYKFADLNARGAEIGIEELHLVHEGLASIPTKAKLQIE
jgi:phage tail-like protein